MMKYVLWDIDGVLTSFSHSRLCSTERREENLFGLDWFDPACVRELKNVIDATGAAIVVSSSWRELGKGRLSVVWESENLPGRLDGTTPEWILTKREAIQEWISAHPNDRYVILDDQDLGFPHQVQTNTNLGLTQEDAIKAIAILNGGV